MPCGDFHFIAACTHKRVRRAYVAKRKLRAGRRETDHASVGRRLL